MSRNKLKVPDVATAASKLLSGRSLSRIKRGTAALARRASRRKRTSQPTRRVRAQFKAGKDI